MDGVLGMNSDSELSGDENNMQSEDKDKCPIDACNIETVKLKRHLGKKKHNLTEEQIIYAIKCSKLLKKMQVKLKEIRMQTKALKYQPSQQKTKLKNVSNLPKTVHEYNRPLKKYT